jgi:putative spermidine/putrescine transport system ATP-binding protein
MMVRPERIRLAEAGTPGWSGEVREVEYLGPFVRYRVDLGEQLELIVNHPNEGQARLPVAPGSASAGRSRRSIACTPPLRAQP